MTSQTVNAPTPKEAPVPCELGRPLGDCQLRQAGCGSLYDVLIMLYPPSTLLAELRSRQNLDHDLAQWLKRLEGIGVHSYERSYHTDFAFRRR